MAIGPQPSELHMTSALRDHFKAEFCQDGNDLIT